MLAGQKEKAPDKLISSALTELYVEAEPGPPG